MGGGEGRGSVLARGLQLGHPVVLLLWNTLAFTAICFILIWGPDQACCIFPFALVPPSMVSVCVVMSVGCHR